MRKATQRLACVAMLVLAGSLQAAPPAAPQLLPESTRLLVRVSDAAEFSELWSETTLGRMMKDEELRPLISQLYGSAVEAFLVVEKEVGLSLTEVLKIPQGEICFALISGEGNRPGLVFYIDCGDNIGDAQLVIDRAMEEAVKNSETIREKKYEGIDLTTVGGGDNAACIFVKQSTVVITTGTVLAEQLIDVWDGKVKDVVTLADNKSFTAIMKKCSGTKDERPQVSFFLDPIGLAQMAVRGNLSAQAGMALLSPLGLYGIQGAGGTLILESEDFDSIAHAHLLLESPREGVLKMIAMKSGPTDPEPWVPEDVATYTTVHWDTMQTHAAFKTLFETIRGEGAMEEQIEAGISGALGVDFREEILQQMAGRFSLVTWIEKPIKINSQCTMIGVELENADKMRATLSKMSTKFSDNMKRTSASGGSYYKLPEMGRRGRRGRDEGRQRELEAVARTPSPCMAIVGDYMLLTDSEPLLKAALAAKRSGIGLAQDLEFKLVSNKIRRQLKTTEPGMLEFNRPEESFKALYGIATSPDVLQMLDRGAARNPALRALNDALQENPLPPFSVLAKYLAPGGAMASEDDTGLHYMAFGLRREEPDED